MAPPKTEKLQKKTEALSLRLDPKVRYALEFSQKVTGQNITTLVEAAIINWADQIQKNGVNWQSFWDVSEGVRELKYLFDSGHFRTYEEDKLKDLVERHKCFFMLPSGRSLSIENYLSMLDRDAIEIIWPKLQSYLQVWEETRASDYWATGRQIKQDLKAAGLTAPTWPPESGTTQITSQNSNQGMDLDDEIPF